MRMSRAGRRAAGPRRHATPACSTPARRRSSTGGLGSFPYTFETTFTGTFNPGYVYVVSLKYRASVSAVAMTLQFGDLAAADYTVRDHVIDAPTANTWLPVSVAWVPSSPRTSVKL